MSAISDIQQTFFQECEELLEALDDGLNEIDDGVSDASFDIETVNAVFRSVHSIKGGAAAFGLDRLVRFAHGFETTLDMMRSGSLTPTEDVMRVCHRAADHLADLVATGREGDELPPDAGQDIAARLANLSGAPAPAETPEDAPPEEDFGFVPMTIPLAMDDAGADNGPAQFDIRFAASAMLYANGNDPVHLFRELDKLGTLTVTADPSELPEFDDIDWRESYLVWDLLLETDSTEADVREVFDFVEGLCELQITRADPPDMPDPGDGPAPGADKPDMENDAATAADADGPTPADTDQKEEAKPQKAAKSSGPKATVRVDLDLVDRLINMVGELVINQAVLTQCIADAGMSDQTELTTNLAEFKNLAREIQESVMAIRAQSVKPLFQRMARIIREAGELSGKSVQFRTEGETTEVDKTVIERLVDPLTHMIRNAVDHGLESPEERAAAGKTESGTVTLAAAHQSGRVLIEVSDDGGGINRPKVFSIAVEKGLIPADAVLSDGEIDKLLFMPGFSTSKTVSDLSGRGVGMDVVRSAIQKLGGRVSIQSQPGKGTTMSISLPLTLAVLDGMVVDVAGQTMVVPITTIVETLRPKPEAIHGLGSGALVVEVRERFVPIIDLGVVFGHRGSVGRISDKVLLLVETDGQKTWALAVDRIYDQRQVVIKGLESNYGHVPGVAAATILGDGKIALIIDPEETAYHHEPDVDEQYPDHPPQEEAA